MAIHISVAVVAVSAVCPLCLRLRLRQGGQPRGLGRRGRSGRWLRPRRRWWLLCPSRWVAPLLSCGRKRPQEPAVLLSAADAASKSPQEKPAGAAKKFASRSRFFCMCSFFCIFAGMKWREIIQIVIGVLQLILQNVKSFITLKHKNHGKN